jgi:hypothetical protein
VTNLNLEPDHLVMHEASLTKVEESYKSSFASGIATVMFPAVSSLSFSSKV